MKSLFVLLVFVALCVFSPVSADEACCTESKPSVQARIREIDMNILLRQYETVQTELAKIEMQLAMNEADDANSAADRKKTAELLTRQQQVLATLSANYVHKLEKLSDVPLASSK
jgi:hypothetical protein